MTAAPKRTKLAGPVAVAIGKPLVDGFGNGLYEVRTGVDTNIYRVLFCIEDGMMVLLRQLDVEKSR